MLRKFIISAYIEGALRQAVYDKLDDGSYCGRIPRCKGVITFAKTLKECEDDLRSTLEDWILLGLILNHRLPIMDKIDINRKPIIREQKYESVVAV